MLNGLCQEFKGKWCNKCFIVLTNLFYFIAITKIHQWEIDESLILFLFNFLFLPARLLTREVLYQ